jgi:hypothetical protein
LDIELRYLVQDNASNLVLLPLAVKTKSRDKDLVHIAKTKRAIVNNTLGGSSDNLLI